MSKPGIAGVLSFILPGLGQVYNGAYFWAIFWLIITPGFWLGTGGLLGFVAHLLSSFAAYNHAQELEARAGT